ncbi:MAG: DUF882 domain-containing protein [Hyphomicrobiaceae bacterium]|nr:MAG: DUF882 domain-containing protein [Hyphomicrobiaceae bacterium]
MTLRLHGLLAGLLAFGLALAMGSPERIRAAGDTRTISLFNIHTKETLTVLYKKEGRNEPAALKRLNHMFRDWRTNEETEMDPALFDIIWEMHVELGSREPIHVVSGYRSRKTNSTLREGGGGQAKNSRHILGKAADVHFPDVPVRQLRYSALVKERGGVGYYPTSAIPFVHVDTDRVRHWPPMPRYELALLFPKGQSKHVPSDGRPITKEDVRTAQAQHKDLAVQIAQFFEVRRNPAERTVIASLSPRPEIAKRPAPPQLPPAPVQPARMALLAKESAPPAADPMPRLAQIPLPTLVTRASLQPTALAKAEDAIADLLSRDARLPSKPTQPKAVEAKPKPAPAPTRVAAIDPKLTRQPAVEPKARLSDETIRSWGNGFQTAPEFDEEHPDELSYRPFPIAPILTEDFGSEHPVLAQTHHPDTRRIFDLLDEPDKLFPLSFRPGKQVAELLWADQFLGNKVGVNTLMGDASVPQAPTGFKQRKVATTVNK